MFTLESSSIGQADDYPIAKGLQVGTVSTKTGNLFLANASSANLTTIQAGNASAAVTYILPTAAPTSNGQSLVSTTGGVMSWATASSTARHSLNPAINITNGQANGTTNPTNNNTLNGVTCSVPGTNGGNSYLQLNIVTAASWDFYDQDPEFDYSVNYSAASGTGDGVCWFGDTGNNIPPTRTQTNKGMFVITDTVSGTPTWYLVNADGTTNTNASMAAVTSAQENRIRVVMDSGTNIKCYVNYTLKATNTTNLPTGDPASTVLCSMGVDNDTGDTQTRTASFGYVDIQLNSPTG